MTSTQSQTLFAQAEDIVAQFEQTKGVVKKIDGTSKQLKEAIEQGTRIIVSTIHKFSTDNLKEISGQAVPRCIFQSNFYQRV